MYLHARLLRELLTIFLPGKTPMSFSEAGLGHNQSVKIQKKCQQVARLPDTGLHKARQTNLSPLRSFTGLQCPVYVINLLKKKK